MLFALSSPGIAHAVDAVLLFQAPGLRPGLCAALRLQLTEVATVTCRDDVREVGLAARLQAASAALVEHGAQLGVLLERDDDPSIVRMMLVGAAADEAVLALERIENRASPDVDRSLALKVRDAYEVMSAAAAANAATAAAAGPAEMPIGELPRTPLAPTARTSLAAVLAPHTRALGSERARALVEAGAGISLAEQTRGLALFGLGMRLSTPGRFFELMLAGQLATRAHARAPSGQVYEDEWGLALALRGAKTWSAFTLGAFAELGGVRVHALGITSRDGSEGEKNRGLLRAGLGLDLRVYLLSGLALRCAPELTLDHVAQSFELDGQEAMALGYLRVVVPISLVLDLALGRASETSRRRSEAIRNSDAN